VISKLVVPHLQAFLKLKAGDEWDFVDYDPAPENRTSIEYLFHVSSHPSRASAW